MDYDFRENHLMYQDKVKAIGGNYNDDASQFFGYPHLKFPNTHYSNYTPFDAIFASPENTVHISSGRFVEVSTNDFIENPFYYSDIKDSIAKFLLLEADVFDGNTFIQNKKYGWNARPNYTYKAAIKTEKELFLGENVTQRTNFKVVEMWSNSDVYLQAGEAIHFMPGFHAQQGATMHAKIENLNCATFISYFKGKPSSGAANESLYGYESDVIETKQLVSDGNEGIKVYPNPSNGLIYIKLLDDEATVTQLFVYSIDGRLIKQNILTSNKYSLNLDEGVYILKIKTKNRWYSKKVIVY